MSFWGPRNAGLVLVVLSSEQRKAFEAEFARFSRPGVEVRFEESPDAGLNQAKTSDPGLVIVGMAVDGMEGIEFVAMLLRAKPDFRGRVVVLPDKGDPFPPVVQFRDPQTGRSKTESIDFAGVDRLVAEIAAASSSPAPEPVPVPEPVPAPEPVAAQRPPSPPAQSPPQAPAKQDPSRALTVPVPAQWASQRETVPAPGMAELARASALSLDPPAGDVSRPLPQGAAKPATRDKAPAPQPRPAAGMPASPQAAIVSAPAPGETAPGRYAAIVARSVPRPAAPQRPASPKATSHPSQDKPALPPAKEAPPITIQEPPPPAGEQVATQPTSPAAPPRGGPTATPALARQASGQAAPPEAAPAVPLPVMAPLEAPPAVPPGPPLPSPSEAGSTVGFAPVRTPSADLAFGAGAQVVRESQKWTRLVVAVVVSLAAAIALAAAATMLVQRAGTPPETPVAPQSSHS